MVHLLDVLGIGGGGLVIFDGDADFFQLRCQRLDGDLIVRGGKNGQGDAPAAGLVHLVGGGIQQGVGSIHIGFVIDVIPVFVHIGMGEEILHQTVAHRNTHAVKHFIDEDILVDTQGDRFADLIGVSVEASFPESAVGSHVEQQGGDRLTGDGRDVHIGVIGVIRHRVGLGGSDGIQHQIQTALVQGIDEDVFVAHEDHRHILDCVTGKFLPQQRFVVVIPQCGGNGAALDITALCNVIGTGAHGREVLLLGGAADGLPDVLGDDDDGIADGLHGGVVVACQGEDKVPVHHLAAEIVRQEIRLGAQGAGVLDNVIKGEFDILRGKGRAVTPGMSLHHLESKTHPVFFGHGNQGALQEFFFRLYDGFAALIEAEFDGFPGALGFPLLLRGIKILVAVEAPLFLGKGAFHLHQTVGKSQRIAVRVGGFVKTAVREGVGLPFHIIHRSGYGAQQGVVEQSHEEGSRHFHGGIGIQILGKLRGTHPEGVLIFIFPTASGK